MYKFLEPFFGKKSARKPLPLFWVDYVLVRDNEEYPRRVRLVAKDKADARRRVLGAHEMMDDGDTRCLILTVEGAGDSGWGEWGEEVKNEVKN